MNNLTKSTVSTILERTLEGYDLSPEEGIKLLKQTDKHVIDAIYTTADKLRFSQAGDTVTYIINRNINFTNICEQHCSFCAFRRDKGDEGAFWLDWANSRKNYRCCKKRCDGNLYARWIKPRSENRW